MIVVGHEPQRPSWDCGCCGVPYPCDPAREQLMATLDRVSLAMFMWECLEMVARDVPTMPISEMFDRFIRWTH